jgi:sucrose-6-phosphate hydrolase SacC (GH32 family)
MSGFPPRFTPSRVGILDHGNGYAAKTGSSIVQTGGRARRVVFGFTGWSEPTAAVGCGRYLVLPRELTVKSDGLHVDPVAETETLRVAGSAMHGISDGNSAAGTTQSELALATGAQLEAYIVCNHTEGGSWPVHGEVILQTLGSADGKHYTAVGWDFSSSEEPFFVDHTRCCKNTSAIVQRAWIATPPRTGQSLEMHVFVDSGKY